MQGEKCELWVADETGEMDDDFPQPKATQLLSKLNETRFYLRSANRDTDARKSISTKYSRHASMGQQQIMFGVFCLFYFFVILFVCLFVLLGYCGKCSENKKKKITQKKNINILFSQK